MRQDHDCLSRFERSAPTAAIRLDILAANPQDCHPLSAFYRVHASTALSVAESPLGKPLERAHFDPLAGRLLAELYEGHVPLGSPDAV